MEVKIMEMTGNHSWHGVKRAPLSMVLTESLTETYLTPDTC